MENCTLDVNEAQVERDFEDLDDSMEFGQRRAAIKHITAFPVYGDDDIKAKK